MTRRGDLMSDRARTDDRNRARAAKAGHTVSTVGAALGLEVADGFVECPQCESLAQITECDEVWTCGCGAGGDVIALVRMREGVGHGAACAWLESADKSPRCAATPDLFGGR